MRRASRPFVVEVKRGTKRSFFSDIKLDQLPPPKQEPKAVSKLFSLPAPDVVENRRLEAIERSGRVLPNLAEPEPIVELEPEPIIVRRGRKPGSKNKPKTRPVESNGRSAHHEVSAETWAMVRAAVAAESQQAPRPPALSAAPAKRPAAKPVASPPLRADPPAPVRSGPRPARAPRVTAPRTNAPRPIAPANIVEQPSHQPPAPPVPEAKPAPRPVIDASTRAEPRARLRARSVILKRYVLGTEPLPGERWRSKSRRKG